MENTATDTQIKPMAYRPKPFPTKPQRVLEYYNLDSKTRERMNKQPDDFKGFWFDPEVKGYFDARDMVISANWSNRRTLNILLAEAILKKQDTTEINNVLAMFTPQDYLFPIELRGCDDVPEEVKEVARQFGGRVERTWNQ